MSLETKLLQVAAIHHEDTPSVKKLLSDPGDVDSLQVLRKANGRIEALGIDRGHEFLKDIGPLQDFAASAEPYLRALEKNPNDEQAKKSLQAVKNRFGTSTDARSYPSDWKNLLKVEAKTLHCMILLLAVNSKANFCIDATIHNGMVSWIYFQPYHPIYRLLK
jgi:hypothetical protein